MTRSAVATLRRLPLLLLVAVAAAASAPAQPLPAGPPRLVEDLSPGVRPTSLDPRSFVSLGDQALFLSVGLSPNGSEIWVTDGTADGTRLLADLCPGPCDSPFLPVWAADGRLLFGASGGLWVTDGTAAGTVRLPASSPFDPFPVVGELDDPRRLVFAAGTPRAAPPHTSSLWVTDGTPGGTRPFFELNPFVLDRVSLPGASTGDRLLFVLEGPGRELELWSTDGTTAGTVRIADIPTGGSAPFPTHLTALGNGTVLFLAAAPETGAELWRTDGTESGTGLLADLTPGPAGSGLLVGPVSGGGSAGSGKAYFVVRHGATGEQELWVSDGTPSGTRALTAFADPRPFGDPTDLRAPSEILQVVGERVFFVADDGAAGREPWTSDGTPLGTRRVEDLCPGPCGSSPRLSPAHLGDGLLFGADDGSTGFEPWFSDGTAAGTRRLTDGCPGPCNGSPILFTADGDRGFFGAHAAAPDPETGFFPPRELWITDGTPGGTRTLTDLPPETGGVNHPEPVFVGDRLLFAAPGPDRLATAWVSDGTRNGTRPLEVGFGPAPAGSDPRAMAAAGRRVYFEQGSDPGLVFWTSDGTAAGTFPADDLLPDGAGTVSGVIPLGARVLLFTAAELWVSDGSEQGTRLLAERPATGGTAAPVERTASSEPVNAVVLRRSERLLDGPRALFFFGDALWVSDATPEGTGPIAPLQPVGHPLVEGPFMAGLGDRVVLSAGSRERGIGAAVWITDGTREGTRLVTSGEGEEEFLPQQLTAAGGLVFFGTRGPNGGRQLWVTDGSPGGTRRLALQAAEPTDLTAVGQRVFFWATSGGPGLYVSDGTDAGTRLVVSAGDGFPATGGLGDTAALGDRLLFAPSDAVRGRELWVSDGTEQGTHPVLDLWPGRAGSEPDHFRVVGDLLLFAASTPGHGREMWAADGTAEGTFRVTDLVPGPGSSSPAEITPVGEAILFAATDGVHGRELWALGSVSDVPPPPPGPWLTSEAVPGFRVKVRIEPPQGGSITGSPEPLCIPETLCVSGAVPGRSEVFVRVVGPKPNGRLWPTLVKFSTSRAEVWIEQLATGEIEHYVLEGARPGFDELPGLFDREGFEPPG